MGDLIPHDRLEQMRAGKAKKLARAVEQTGMSAEELRPSPVRGERGVVDFKEGVERAKRRAKLDPHRSPATSSGPQSKIFSESVQSAERMIKDTIDEIRHDSAGGKMMRGMNGAVALLCAHNALNLLTHARQPDETGHMKTDASRVGLGLLMGVLAAGSATLALKPNVASQVIHI